MDKDVRKNRGIRFDDAEWRAITRLAQDHGINQPSTFVRERMLNTLRNRQPSPDAVQQNGVDERQLSAQMVATLHDSTREKMTFSALLETFILLRKLAQQTDPALVTAAHEEAKKIRMDLDVELTQNDSAERNGE
jgi:hypothetical protein